MKATEGTIGRVFIIRLEDGDRLPHCLEAFAKEKNIKAGLITMVGGIGSGEIVVGPYRSEEKPINPIHLPVDGAHETVAIGVIAQNEYGDPAIHMHASLGRAGKTVTGCLRPGVTTWLVGEVILYEILDTSSKRLPDASWGFPLLDP